MNIFVAPESCSKLETVKFPHPKNPQESQCYLYDEENLTTYEVVKYADQYRSWFVDNLLCQEGHMNFLTRINPIYIFLPPLIQYASDQFRSLHDICQTFSSAPENRGYSRLNYALSPSIVWSKVCDTREVDNELYVKFNESKTLDWLLERHKKILAVLTEAQATKTTKTSIANLTLEASALMEQYVPVSLTEKFKALVRNAASLYLANLKVDATNSEVASGTKRSAPSTSSPAVASRAKAAAAAASSTRQKVEPVKSGGIMNFFKPKEKLMMRRQN